MSDKLRFEKSGDAPVFLYGHNNGKIFVVVNTDGPLGHLAENVNLIDFPEESCQRERGWLFMTGKLLTWQSAGNTWIIDHHYTGVANGGTHNDFDTIARLLKTLGLKMKYDNRWVPFSNGQLRFGHFTGDDKGPFNEWQIIELAELRVDAPPTTTERLLEMFTEAHEVGNITGEELANIIRHIIEVMMAEIRGKEKMIDSLGKKAVNLEGGHPAEDGH